MHWLPPNGALHGIALDHLLRWNLSIVFWLFTAAQVMLLAAMFLRRRSGDQSTPSKRRTPRSVLFAEVLPLLAVTVLYGWMIFTSHKLWAARRESAMAPRSIQVEVTGVQFQWYFRYPGRDGVFGSLRPQLVNAPAGNPLGLDPADPHSADDFVSSILVVPAGQAIDLRLRSQDVIHGFFIPGMRLKQDTIPGMPGRIAFTPATPGDYPILCSQVCGLGHSRMQARLRVVSPADYDRWLAGREHAMANAEASQ
ncbi:MAG TPA: hypothetical protein VKT75_13055 [Acidobacteriaceae bacterium]|nr:hypothetical protein [Acidobacteriaceae bacterium]